MGSKDNSRAFTRQSQITAGGMRPCLTWQKLHGITTNPFSSDKISPSAEWGILQFWHQLDKKRHCLWLPCDQSCLILAGLNSRVSRAGGEQFELVWFIGKICGASGEYLWYFLHLRQFYSRSGVKAGRQKRPFESQSIPSHVHQFQI